MNDYLAFIQEEYEGDTQSCGHHEFNAEYYSYPNPEGGFFEWTICIRRTEGEKCNHRECVIHPSEPCDCIVMADYKVGIYIPQLVKIVETYLRMTKVESWKFNRYEIEDTNNITCLIKGYSEAEILYFFDKGVSISKYDNCLEVKFNLYRTIRKAFGITEIEGIGGI